MSSQDIFVVVRTDEALSLVDTFRFHLSWNGFFLFKLRSDSLRDVINEGTQTWNSRPTEFWIVI
ncbi:hypothetical protein D3C72_1309270 [compost metagenome]